MSTQFIVSGKIKETHIETKYSYTGNLGLKFSLITFFTKCDVVEINIV